MVPPTGTLLQEQLGKRMRCSILKSVAFTSRALLGHSHFLAKVTNRKLHDLNCVIPHGS